MIEMLDRKIVKFAVSENTVEIILIKIDKLLSIHENKNKFKIHWPEVSIISDCKIKNMHIIVLCVRISAS